jgi:hypothetical protein
MNEYMMKSKLGEPHSHSARKCDTRTDNCSRIITEPLPRSHPYCALANKKTALPIFRKSFL